MVKINLGNIIRSTIISSVLGQMSDGMWENTKAMEKYWKNANLNGNTLTVNNDNSDSGFHQKSDTEIRIYFANKIKQVVKECCGDSKGIWKRMSTRYVDYLSRSSIDIDISMAYECYDFILGRNQVNKEYAFLTNNSNILIDAQIQLFVHESFDSALYEFGLSSMGSPLEKFINSIVDYFKNESDYFVVNGKIDENILISMFNNEEDLKSLNWPNSEEIGHKLDSYCIRHMREIIGLIDEYGESEEPSGYFKVLYINNDGIRPIFANKLVKRIKEYNLDILTD